jgi:hypothetical protein
MQQWCLCEGARQTAAFEQRESAPTMRSSAVHGSSNILSRGGISHDRAVDRVNRVMPTKRVLITGGADFAGRNAARFFRAGGTHVIDGFMPKRAAF